MSVVGWASESLLESLGMRISRARFRWFGWLGLASALAAALWAVWPQAAADPAAGEIASWSAVSEAAGEITVRWETPSPAPSDYRLNWGPADQPFPSWRDALGNEFPRDNGLTLSELTPGASYKLRLRARYNAGAYARSPWSGPWTAELVVEVADEQADEQAVEDAQEDPPPAPTGLRAEATDGVVRLTWDDPDDASITGFRIERGPDADSLAALTQVAADQRSFADYATQASTSYLYALRALRGETAGERSQTLELLAPPAPPSGLQATLETRGVRLTWDDPLDHAVSGYRLLRRPASGDGGPAALSVPPSFRARGILDAAAQPGRAYRYSLQARNAGGWSAYAAPVLVETLGLALAGQLALARWNEPEQPRLGFDADAGQGAFRLAGAADARWIDLRSLVLRPQPERSLVLVLGQPSRRPFLLWLGGQALYSQAAASQPRGEGRAYTWSEPCLDWTDGQQVTLRLERIAPDDPRLAQLGAPTLARLSLQGARLLQPFQTRDLHYRAELDADAAQVTVELETNPLGVCGLSLEPADADPQTDGHQLEVGAEGAELRITVQGADGAQQTYTVGLAPAGAQPAGLRQLQLAGPEPIAFQPTERRYDAPLPSDTEQVELTVEPAAPGQQLQGHVVRAAEFLVHEQALAEPVAVDPRGDTLVLIEVRSADGLRREPYRLRLRPATQPDAPNSSPALFSQLGGFSPTPAPRLSALSLSAGQLSPAFQPGRFDYAARVGPDVARITVGPAAADGAAWRILPADADPDTDGHQVDLYAPRQGRDAQTVVSVIVRSADGLRLDSYDVTVTREAAADDARLVEISLDLDGTELTPGFESGTMNYLSTVANSVTSATLTVRAAHAEATVAVEPADADPDTDGHQLAFAVGENLVRVTVTAENGHDTRVYSLRVTRAEAEADDASLSALSLSGLTLHPEFIPDHTDYEVSLTAEVSQITLTVTTTHSLAAFAISPADADPNTDGYQLSVAAPGDLVVLITVATMDGQASRVYTVRVRDDRLRWLSVGHLPITLQGDQSRYNVSVPEEVAEVTIGHGSRNGAQPRVRIGSGDAAREIVGHQAGLTSGATELPVIVEGRFGRSSASYTLAITRQTPEAEADAKLSALSIDVGTAISFDPLVFWYWVTDIGDSPQSATVAATAAQTGATVTISPADSDPDADGHQVAFTGERMRITITVTSSDGSATRTYTIALHRKLEWADFEMGWTHGCGLRSDGRIFCVDEARAKVWKSPIAASSPPAQYVYRDVIAGKHESCGVLVNGVFHCWTGTGNKFHGPDISAQTPIPEWGVRQVSYFTYTTDCWLDDQSLVQCYPLVHASVRGRPHQQVAVAYDLACALDTQGAVACWTHTYNRSQERWTATLLDTPQGEYKYLAAGGRAMACGIKRSGALLCWSYDDGNGIRGAQASVLVRDDAHRYSMADVTYRWSFCALRESGEALCSRDARSRASDLYRPQTPGATFTHLSLGYNPSSTRRCGLTSEGQIECWNTDRYSNLTDPDWQIKLSSATGLGELSLAGIDTWPEFSASRTDYQATVDNETTAATLTVRAAHAEATVAVEPADADPDTDGHQLAFAVGENLVRVTVTAENGHDTRVYSLRVTRAEAEADDASLSALSLSGLTLHPEFIPDHTDYEVSLTAEVSQITLTVTTTHSLAAFAISPADADPNTDGYQLSVAAPGDLVVLITVATMDGQASRVYTVRVRDDRLRWLSVGHLPITLQGDQSRYNVSVPEEVAEVTIGHGSRNGAQPRVRIGSGDAAREIVGHQAGLTSGATELPVIVEGRFGRSSASYTLAITRQTPEAEADAKLSALSIDVGTAISFDPLVFWYWVTDIGDSPQSATVAATAAQTGATVTISPADSDPDADGHQVAFTGERMRITITVTSSDGSATRTYTIALHRKLEWADFEMGWTHGCGLRSDGRIFCVDEARAKVWKSPIAASSPPAQYVYRDVIAGKHESCGVLVNGVFHCWTGTGNKFHGPDISAQTPIPEWGVRQVSYFTYTTDCWLDDQSLVQCYPLVHASVRGRPHQQVAVAYDLACALDTQGAVACWTHTYNRSQERWTATLLDTPQGEYKYLAAGGRAMACGIKRSGALLCWSYDDGNGIRGAQASVLVRDDAHRYSMADVTYRWSFCALRESGEALCSRDARSRASDLYRPQTPGATFTHLSLGYNPSSTRRCGLTSEGQIECWNTDRYSNLTDPDWLRP